MERERQRVSLSLRSSHVAVTLIVKCIREYQKITNTRREEFRHQFNDVIILSSHWSILLNLHLVE